MRRVRRGRKRAGILREAAENDRIGLCSGVRKSLRVNPSTEPARSEPSLRSEWRRLPRRRDCTPSYILPHIKKMGEELDRAPLGMAHTLQANLIARCAHVADSFARLASSPGVR